MLLLIGLNIVMEARPYHVSSPSVKILNLICFLANGASPCTE